MLFHVCLSTFTLILTVTDGIKCFVSYIVPKSAHYASGTQVPICKEGRTGGEE